MAGNAKHISIERATAYWQPDFRAEVSKENLWTATHSFLCHIADAPQLIPQKGAFCQEEGFQFLNYASCSVENIEGDLARVTCSYSGKQPNESGGDDPEEPDDQFLAENYEMNVSVSEEPIESHPRYKDISELDRDYLAGIREGRIVQVRNSSSEVVENTYYDKSQGIVASAYLFTDEKAAELANKLASGIFSYQVPKQIWRETRTVALDEDGNVPNSLNIPAKLNRVGYISTPNKAPQLNAGVGINKRNYLFTGMNLSIDKATNTATISYEFQVSGPGGWDEDLYDKTKQ
jgi:hypothetical protein